MLLDNSAPAHKALVARAALRDWIRGIITPTLPPDLALCDFHLFRILKEHLCGKHFEDNNSTQRQKSGYIEGRKEENVLFNDALNTFYLRLYGVGHMVKYHSDSERKPAAATWATLSD